MQNISFFNLDFWSLKIQEKKVLSFIAIILGLIATLGFAPYSIWPLTILALSFFLFTLFVQKRALTVFIATLAFMTAYNAATLSWLNFVMQDFGKMPFLLSWTVEILFSVYLSLPYAILFALVFKYSGKSAIAKVLCYYPIAYVIADFIVGYLFTGFPWTYIGYSGVESPFKTYAPLVGVRGINFLMILSAASIALTITRRFIFLPIAGFIFGFAILFMGQNYTKDGEKYDFVLVQGNIEQSVKWKKEAVVPTIDKYLSLSLDKIAAGKTVIWPESAIPVIVANAQPLLISLQDILKDTDGVFITGIQDYNAKTHSIYNTILTLDKNSDIDSPTLYAKRQLVPFGEFVPFEDVLRPLGSIFNFPMSGFSRGEYLQDNIHVKDLNLIPAICYEAIFSELIASLNKEDSGGILMVSNDSWFGLTRGPLEHLEIAKMRSLELQKPMLRVTNSGITALINKDGTIEKILPQNKAKILEVNLIKATGLTPYARFGNILLFVLIVVLGIFGFIINKKNFDPADDKINSLLRP